MINRRFVPTESTDVSFLRNENYFCCFLPMFRAYGIYRYFVPMESTDVSFLRNLPIFRSYGTRVIFAVFYRYFVPTESTDISFLRNYRYFVPAESTDISFLRNLPMLRSYGIYRYFVPKVHRQNCLCIDIYISLLQNVNEVVCALPTMISSYDCFLMFHFYITSVIFCQFLRKTSPISNQLAYWNDHVLSKDYLIRPKIDLSHPQIERCHFEILVISNIFHRFFE